MAKLSITAESSPDNESMTFGELRTFVQDAMREDVSDDTMIYADLRLAFRSPAPIKRIVAEVTDR